MSKRSSFFEVNSYAHEPEEQDVKSYRIKVLVVGGKNVGKSSILYQYTRQRNPQFENPTVGTDFVSKVEYLPKGIECHLQIWDTADYNSPSIPPRLFERALGVIIVYDITNSDSFKLVLAILNDLAYKGDKDKQVFLVGNKLDMATNLNKREVSEMDVQSLKRNRRFNTRELSATSYQQVEELFQEMTRLIIEKVDRKVIKKELIELEAGSRGRVVLGGEGFVKRHNKCC